MKNFRKYILLAGIVALSGSGCGNDTATSDQSRDTTSQVPDSLTVPQFVGTWTGSFPKSSLIHLTDTMNLVAEIRSDSTYALVAQYATTKDTTLKSIGKWTDSLDTLQLDGSLCQVIDTLADTLRTLPACDPIRLKINIQANETWPIQLYDLIPIAESMGVVVDPVTQQELKSINAPIVFTKKN